MSAFTSLFRRELALYFLTPTAYVMVAVFWAASGFFFSFNTLFVSAIDMVTAFHNMSLLLMLMLPLASMRTIAEERQNGTLALLLSLPVGDGAIVLAKYAGLLVLLVLMLVGSASAVLALLWFADPDLGPILGGYAGVFMLGATFAAVGVLVSALAPSQLVAAVLTWALLLALWFIDYGAALVEHGAAVALLRHVSFSVQYLDLIRGVLGSPAVAWFAGLSAVCLVGAREALALGRAV
ncbi:MAG: ABC transporter permease [Gammaproteobacteria bacterium]